MASLSYASGVFAIATWPARIAWKPVALFINTALILLSPLILMASYVIGWGQAIMDFLASLQLACGACIGIVAGLTMSCTSGVITTIFGMGDNRSRSLPPTPMPSTPSSERPGTGKTEDSSSYETDWHILNKPPPKRRRRTPGLWSQTIHEEDDDDSEI
ncbi:hypothetical protein CH63R_04430 [Colletotrichum higginsianum IMI 349063]|uniref:Uncharacterized protein n=2 Tax=Colletotrichum higginsianum TaxID=80884 RepID=A0A1B7YJR2_COLHI|nr:hypothetical protein CH63R_04430 [Colletotrichum higginsianum IMI 349063]OBR12134.1 hypothetical protein CH63R_04430 [Colletotrichum higginsianum IMI 349063]TIC99577.1 hypothetical protein CH35J_005722 [Colletotrichum higginsianum]GJC93811.1 hypothetical protein ColKHC_02637 [Colletotrichum higginsianum]